MPVVCDSTKLQDIEGLFGQIKREQDGRLDLLVNNAYAGVQVPRRRGRPRPSNRVEITPPPPLLGWNVVPGHLRQHGQKVLGNGAVHLGLHQRRRPQVRSGGVDASPANSKADVVVPATGATTSSPSTPLG